LSGRKYPEASVQCVTSRRSADAVTQAGDASLLGAMLTAEESALLLEPVTDDTDAASFTGRREGMNCAFEAVEGVGGPRHAYLKGLVIIVSAGFTFGHDDLPPVGPGAITRTRQRQFQPLLQKASDRSCPANKIATGQKRRLTPQIKREFKRRAAIEPVIGHLKEHHRMGRNHLAHASGDAANAVLAAAGYNFRRLLAWLRFLLLRILIALGLADQFKLA